MAGKPRGREIPNRAPPEEEPKGDRETGPTHPAMHRLRRRPRVEIGQRVVVGIPRVRKGESLRNRAPNKRRVGKPSRERRFSKSVVTVVLPASVREMVPERQGLNGASGA